MISSRFRHRLGPALAALMTLALPGASEAETAPFAPGMDGLCSAGRKLSEGCDAIRARAIVDAAEPPWSALGRVNFAGIRIRTHCTGTLVSDRIVLTAAHCLYNAPRKRWRPAQTGTFAAGYQRGEAAAVSRVARYVLDPVHDPHSRAFRGGVAEDWALLILEDPIGRKAGFLGLLTGDAAGDPVRVAGYPALRPHVLSVAGDCGDLRALKEGRVAVAGCSIMQGDSGAPFLVFGKGGPRVAGVVSAVRVDGARVQSLGVPIQGFSHALREEMQR